MRHPVLTRVTHATFSAAFFGLALTGTLIYFHKRWIPHAGLVHDAFAVLMIVSGITYLAHAIVSGGLRRMLFTSDDAAGVLPMAAYYLRLRGTPPAYVTYNPLQKVAYTAVLMLIAPLIVASGAALFFHVRAASVWHVGFAVELVAFFFGHMVMVTATGLQKNLRAIGLSLPFLTAHTDRPTSRQTGTPLQSAPSHPR
jgi:thiosulfate reductase cytochrome b subunit